MMSASPTEKQNAAPAGTGTADREHCHKKNTTNATPRKAYRAQAEWRKRNPLKRWAHVATDNAIRNGILKRPDACEKCGAAGPVDAHHDDYLAPLSVKFWCRSCHRKHHARSDA
ncbi:hypothetical protein [Paracoccus saliphilus]|uniref:Uncharacterized protein n=1 Tax=Paracoccus saliphilus TaxID=405559 RepID=A0AA45W4L3_9RHOB|nr:hypothetical protein [Paracoccus saliphilus]WCR05456.1 hypothetical protein JHX88_07490 [Paracoccus saliphilus]SIS86700.1 hypothetical protein SAMN05421772_1078 [Paracoccus saliphilus]